MRSAGRLRPAVCSVPRASSFVFRVLKSILRLPQQPKARLPADILTSTPLPESAPDDSDAPAVRFRTPGAVVKTSERVVATIRPPKALSRGLAQTAITPWRAPKEPVQLYSTCVKELVKHNRPHGPRALTTRRNVFSGKVLHRLRPLPSDLFGQARAGGPQNTQVCDPPSVPRCRGPPRPSIVLATVALAT